MTADDKYSLLNRENLIQSIQMHPCRKQQTFSEFFHAYLKSELNFEHFQKKITLTADIFPKLRTPKKDG